MSDAVCYTMIYLAIPLKWVVFPDSYYKRFLEELAGF
jgi:hypothetical protein